MQPYRVKSRYETYIKGGKGEKDKKVIRRRGEIIPADQAAKIPNLSALEKSGYLEKIPGDEMNAGGDKT